MLNDVLWEEGERHLHIFIPVNRRVKVYTFLMSAPAKRAPFVLILLFQRILEETMSVVHVMSSKG
jgi:hypothetical protein